MRKIFRIASLALLLGVGVACTNEDVPNSPQGTYPILFRCADETRAGSNIESLKNDGFKVYAYFEGNNQKSNFEKAVKYYEPEEGPFYWNFEEGVEYWIPGATYWFKAVYPKAIGSVEYASQSSPITLKIEDFDISSQTDLLVAEAGPLTVDPDLGAPGSGSVVSLQFKHLLACVVVKIKAEVNVTINNLSLKYVQVKGTYAEGSWKYSSQGNIEKVGLDKTLSSSSNAYHDVTDGGFLVFPSSVDGVKLYIDTSDKTYELPLKAPDSWNMGTKYTYTLTIKQNDIHFDEPTVEEWDEENAVGSVIIK